MAAANDSKPALPPTSITALDPIDIGATGV